MTADVDGMRPWQRICVRVDTRSVCSRGGFPIAGLQVSIWSPLLRVPVGAGIGPRGQSSGRMAMGGMTEDRDVSVMHMNCLDESGRQYMMGYACAEVGGRKLR